MAVSMSANWSSPNRRTSAATRRPRAARNVRSSIATLSLGGSRALRLFEYANLDIPVLQPERRTSARKRDGLLERIRLQKDDSAYGFLRLHEWPFDHLPASHGQPCARLIPELVRRDDL